MTYHVRFTPQALEDLSQLDTPIAKRIAEARKPWNKVAVALAAKHARILWAMLARGDIYRPNAATSACTQAPA
ncbi:MAG: hypothetical protein ACREX4_03450 [Gammaproteobacteria bacterium]